MSGHKIPLGDMVVPLVQPPACVNLEVCGKIFRLTAGDQVVTSAGVIRVIGIDRPIARPVNSNGKTMFRVVGSAGDECTEYVRSEERAREIFAEKFPGQEISEVSLT